MNCPGVIVLVVTLVGVQNGAITPAMQAGVVLVALITTAMTGPLLTAFRTQRFTASLVPTPLNCRSDGSDLRTSRAVNRGHGLGSGVSGVSGAVGEIAAEIAEFDVEPDQFGG